MAAATHRGVSVSAAVLLCCAVGAVGCPKPEVPEPVVDDVGELPQVVQVVPNTVTAWVDSRVVAQGSGFAFGATVWVGDLEVTSRVDDSHAIRLMVPSLAAGEYDLRVMNPTGALSVHRGALVVAQRDVADCDEVTLFFGPLAADAHEPVREAVSATAGCLDARGDDIVVEGYARDLQTTELALAIGYQRAKEVAGLLAAQGVEEDRVLVVSYGAEAPVGVQGPDAGVEVRAGDNVGPRVGRYGSYGAKY